MASNLISRQKPIKRLFQCNKCNKAYVEENGNGLPAGFHLQLTKVDKDGKWVEQNGDIWYCTKACMLDGLKYHNY